MRKVHISKSSTGNHEETSRKPSGKPSGNRTKTITSPSGAPSLNPRAGAQDLVRETSAPKCLMNPIQVVFCCCPMNSIQWQRQYVAQKIVKASRSSLGISASGKLQKKIMSTYVKPLNFIFLHHLRVTSYRLGQPHEF